MKKFILISMVSLLFVGCDPKQQTVGRSAITRTSNVFGGLNTGYVSSNSCANQQAGLGTIFETSYTVQVPQYNNFATNGSFEQRVKNLLSATMDPSEVGQISALDNDQSSRTGVRFQGTIKLDQNGNVIPAQTRLYIKIYDSFVASGQTDANGQPYQPIPISFENQAGQTVAGQINKQTGQGTIIFRDQYGEIRLDGQAGADGYFKGSVSFTNTTTVLQGQAPASGLLGQFYIATCAFIQ